MWPYVRGAISAWAEGGRVFREASSEVGGWLEGEGGGGGVVGGLSILFTIILATH